MTVTNAPGQNSIIERPTASNITDNATSTPGRDRAIKNAVFAPKWNHLKRMSAKYDAAREARANQLIALSKKEGEIKFDFEQDAYAARKSNVEIDPAIVAEFNSQIAEVKAERRDLEKTKIPILDLDNVTKAAARLRNWLLHTTAYFVGDTRHCSEWRKEARAVRIAADADLDAVIQADRHSDDAMASVDRWLDRECAKGEINIGKSLQGFTIDHKGEFQLNLNPDPEIPETWSKNTEYSADLAMVDDSTRVLLNICREIVREKLYSQIMAKANDADAIRDADRPRLIAAAKAKLLAAQRAEEFANVACEKAGIPVFRPSGWPPEVLLEVEAPPKTKPVPVVNAAPEDADAPDFEDADAE